MEFLTQRAQACDSPGRHGRAWVILLVILLGAGFFAPQLRAQSFKEYDIKAAFLYHLANFVEWPAESFPAAESPFVIGVLGQDPFGKALDEIVQNEVVKDRKLVVQRFRQLDEILASLKGRHVLTVGDSESFARQGGIIRFVTEKNKIRLRINIESAKA